MASSSLLDTIPQVTAMNKMERNILLNCCEEWILRYGQFYPKGKEFQCLPCNHGWRKEGEKFIEGRTEIVYTRTSTKGGFEYLAPEGTPPPILNRCCSTILIKFGPRTRKPVNNFQCPICSTKWRMERQRLFSIDQDVYVDENSGHQFVLVEDPFADYLKPLQ